jgi:hypothetical protein
MASRTQIRLGQITGSFGTDAINDQIAAAATGSIATTDLQGVLSHLAGAIKRIHGEDSFTQNAAGEFAVTLQPSTDDGAALGGASNNWSDLFLADGAVINLGDDQDVKLTHVADKGILLTGTGLNQLAFRDADLVISSSADGTLDIEADTQINIGTDRSGIAISLGHATSEVTVNDNLTVTGDLTVNGTTTTLDTTNLLVEDPIIVLNKNNSSANGQGGIAIEQGGSTNDLVFGRVANDTWGVGTKDTSGGTVTTVADMTLTTFRASKIEIDGASDTIDVTASDLTAVASANFKVDAATDIILDADGADIFFDDGGTRFGGISMNAGASYLIVSSSAGNNVALASQGGQVFIGDKEFSGLTIAADTANELQFIDRDDRLRINLESSAGNDQILLSGSVFLDNGAAAAQLVFEEAAANGSNTITLDIPASVGTSYTITLPASNGSSGQVLKLADANGNLEFGDATGDLARFAYKATAAVSAGNVDFGSSKTAGISALAVGTADLNITKAASELNNALEVYVNGQLLVSGSDGGADTDYTFIDADTLKFAFGLEADDIIQIIQR